MKTLTQLANECRCYGDKHEDTCEYYQRVSTLFPEASKTERLINPMDRLDRDFYTPEEMQELDKLYTGVPIIYISDLKYTLQTCYPPSEKQLAVLRERQQGEKGA